MSIKTLFEDNLKTYLEVKAGSLTLAEGDTVSLIDNDPSLTADSDERLCTQKAYKSYVDGGLGDYWVEQPPNSVIPVDFRGFEIGTTGGTTTALLIDHDTTSNNAFMSIAKLTTPKTCGINFNEGTTPIWSIAEINNDFGLVDNTTAQGIFRCQRGQNYIDFGDTIIDMQNKIVGSVASTGKIDISGINKVVFPTPTNQILETGFNNLFFDCDAVKYIGYTIAGAPTPMLQIDNVGVKSNFTATNTVTGVAMYINVASGEMGVLAPSIERAKMNIEPLEINKLHDLTPIKFNYRANPEPLQYGFLAESLEKKDRNLVAYDKDNNLLGINALRMYALLVKSLQDMMKEAKLLEAEIYKLKNI
jgi:hypothetical protein